MTRLINHWFIGTWHKELWWQPWANTVMYYPFKTDQLDKVGNSSIPITWVKENLWYTFSSSDFIYLTNPDTSCRFVSVWVKYNSNNWAYNQWPSTCVGFICYNFGHTGSDWIRRFQIETSNDYYITSSAQSTTSWVWYHLAMWYDGSKVYAYLNWAKVWEQTTNAYIRWKIFLWRMINETVSEYIGESVCWTAQEITDYYNSTKANYWIS